MRIFIAAVLVTFLSSVFISAQSAPKRTVWDGAYTDAQAERASATFDTTCSRCHTLDPLGNRAITGDKFWQGYSQKTVGDLLAYVSTSMPNGNGGSLSPQTYNDLVALILKANGFPAGSAEVTPEAVAGIQIIPKDGPGELPSNTLVRIVGCLTKSGSDWVLTRSTAPERNEKAAPGSTDATRTLGTGSMTLKFVLTKPTTRLWASAWSVSGLVDRGPAGWMGSTSRPSIRSRKFAHKLRLSGP